ncbi:MAG TPA: cell division protein FtsL [Usitatibacter sp.]
MRRVNAVLLVLVIVSALSVITSQHHARQLFSQLEGELAQASKLGEEFTQLQLEQSTWATNKRVESVASRSLGMRLPDPTDTVIVTLDSRTTPAPGAGADKDKP